MLMYASEVFDFYNTLGVYRLETNKLSFSLRISSLVRDLCRQFGRQLKPRLYYLLFAKDCSVQMIKVYIFHFTYSPISLICIIYPTKKKRTSKISPLSFPFNAKMPIVIKTYFCSKLS